MNVSRFCARACMGLLAISLSAFAIPAFAQTTADLELVTSFALPDPIVAGSTPAPNLVYEAQINNNGPDAVVFDQYFIEVDYPTGVTFNSTTTTDLNCINAIPVLCNFTSNAGDIAGDGSGAPLIEILWDVAADAPAGQVQFFTTLVVDPAVTDPTPENNVRDAPFEINRQSNSAVDVNNVAPTSPIAGTQATFDVVVSNTGPSDSDATTRVDVTLPAGFAHFSDDGSCTGSGANWSCDVGSLPAGNPPTPTTIKFTVDVLSSATTPQTVMATVVDATDTDGANDDDSEAIDITYESNSAVVINNVIPESTLTAGAVVAGTQITFDVVASNTGPSDSDAATNIDVTIPAGFAYSSDNGGCTGAGANWNCVVGALPAGNPPAPTTITFTVDVAPNATSPQTIDAVITDATDTDTGNNTDSEDVVVVLEFDLGLAAMDTPDPVVAGSGAPNLTHVLTLSRVGGPSDAPGVTVDVVATLPAGVTIFNWAETIGTFDGATWTIGDVLASSTGDIGTLTINLTVDSTTASCDACVSAEGTIMTTSGTDTDTANDTAVDPTEVINPVDLTTTFDTSILFTNGYTGSVMVQRICNKGVDLVQEFEIEEANGVEFQINNLPFTEAGTECEITVTSDIANYELYGSANGAQQVEGGCFYDVDTLFNFDLEGMNTCELTAMPLPSTFTVIKEWDGVEDGITSKDYSLQVQCTNASYNTGDSFGTINWQVFSYGDGEFDFTLYPNWDTGTNDEGSVCRAFEYFDSSAVEGDGGCEAGVRFELGVEEGECTIVNTVFFEGIPTLSQYGMALMALLMLGVGFVSVRRFA